MKYKKNQTSESVSSDNLLDICGNYLSNNNGLSSSKAILSPHNHGNTEDKSIDDKCSLIVKKTQENGKKNFWVFKSDGSIYNANLSLKCASDLVGFYFKKNPELEVIYEGVSGYEVGFIECRNGQYTSTKENETEAHQPSVRTYH